MTRMEREHIISKLEELKSGGEWKLVERNYGTDVTVRFDRVEEIDTGSAVKGEWVILIGGDSVDEIDTSDVREVADYLIEIEAI